MFRTALPTVERLSETVWRVLGCNSNQLTLQGTNTYLVGTGKRRILIDTGNGGIAEYVTALREVLTRDQCTVQEVILTHHHPDHVGGVEDVCSLVNEKIPVWKYPGVEDLVQYSSISDNQVFKTEGATLRAVYTPGHTPDHISLFMEEDKTLFTGDCILGEATAAFEDLHDYMLSLRRLLTLGAVRIYPGHGPVVEECQQKIEEYIQHRQMREDQIVATMKSEQRTITPRELVQLIYPELPNLLTLKAEENVEHHLTKLKTEGVVDYEENGWKLNPTSRL